MMDRREFVRTVGLGAAALGLGSMEGCRTPPRRPPNVLFIMADDLGYNEVGLYGQDKIRTPSIDRIGREGMRFTQHYSGQPGLCPVPMRAPHRPSRRPCLHPRQR